MPVSVNVLLISYFRRMDPVTRLKTLLDKEEIWQTVYFNRNDYISTKGSTNTHLYYVQNGSCRVFMLDDSAEHTIRFGYTGSFITALDSFITGKPSAFYIQALKKTTLKVVDKRRYMEFIEANASNMQLWYQLLEGLILQQMEREVDLLTASPDERYDRVLKRSPQLFQEIPQKYIASYLRMTPETFSRLKKT